MQSAKNAAASAKAGMEKTKATLQEKAEKMTTRDPLQKEMATEKKDERLRQAELQKQQERAHGGVGLGAGTGATGGGYTAGAGIPPTAEVFEGGVREEYPQGGGRTGLGSGGVGPTDPNVGGGARTGYGSGGTI